MTLALHPSTEALLQTPLTALPHALLLSGKQGVGLLTIAKSLASTHLGIIVQPEDKKGQPDANGTISVEMIRKLYERTQGKQTSPLVVIVDDADRMSRGAQAAFLKLLEEPAPLVHFVLTAHAPQLLLPTIRSRLQQFIVQPVSAQASATLIETMGVSDATKKAQLQFIAGGLPAEITRLARDEAYFKTRAQVMGDAREFLMADAYKKLSIAQKYQADRAGALQLLDGALLIGRRSLSAKPQAELVRQLERLLEVRENIAANCNVRLQLAQFAT